MNRGARGGRAPDAPMIPYIDLSNLHIAGIRIHAFGVLMVTAIVVGHVVLVRRAKALGVGAPGEVDAFAVVTVGAGMLAAYMESLIEGSRDALDAAGDAARASFDLSSAKGLAAAIFAGVVFLHVRKLDRRRFADVAAFALPFGWFFARMGCAVAHDHLGRLSTSWLAVRFPSGARFDMGLLEWLLSPILIALVVVVSRRTTRRGAVAGALAIAYALLRFSLDFLRADDLGSRSDPRWMGLTAAQWGAIPLFAAGVILILTAPRELPEQAQGQPNR